MKKVMISQPMTNKTEEEILNERNRIKESLESQGYEVIDTYITEKPPKGTINTSLWYQAKSLELMSKCDIVYLCNGWEKARGCKLELKAAKAYGIEIMFENFKGMVMSHDYIYSLMYSPQKVNFRTLEEQIIKIDTSRLDWYGDGTGFYYIWGWPGPDANEYNLDTYGRGWAFTKEEIIKSWEE